MGCCASKPAAAKGTPTGAPPVARAQNETPTETVYTDNQFRELGERIEHTKGAQAAVRLLKASYLIELHRSDKKLVRRQDLPEDAFYTGPLDHDHFRLLAISCKACANSNPLMPLCQPR